MIVVGGVVPPQDYEELKRAGAEAIFPPGTVIAEAAEGLLKTLNKRLGHGPHVVQKMVSAQAPEWSLDVADLIGGAAFRGAVRA